MFHKDSIPKLMICTLCLSLAILCGKKSSWFSKWSRSKALIFRLGQSLLGDVVQAKKRTSFSDTSSKLIDRDSLGESRTGTRQIV